jgi:hypothetical protein
VNFDECHNDSTTISFYGSYRGASGRKIRGRTAPMITYGHSKYVATTVMWRSPGNPLIHRGFAPGLAT